MIEERYRLAVDRIGEMKEEQTTGERFRDYFLKMSDFVMMIRELASCIRDGSYRSLGLTELKEWNQRLYEDILPENYGRSYGNPVYAAKILGEDYGQMLSFLYTELRGAIVYAFEEKTEYLDILFELLIQILCE